MKLLNQKILDASNIILDKSQKVSTDWVVVSPKYGLLLQDIIKEEQHKIQIRERKLKIQKLKSKL